MLLPLLLREKLPLGLLLELLEFSSDKLLSGLLRLRVVGNLYFPPIEGEAWVLAEEDKGRGVVIPEPKVVVRLMLVARVSLLFSARLVILFVDWDFASRCESGTITIGFGLTSVVGVLVLFVLVDVSVVVLCGALSVLVLLVRKGLFVVNILGVGVVVASFVFVVAFVVVNGLGVVVVGVVFAAVLVFVVNGLRVVVVVVVFVVVLFVLRALLVNFGAAGVILVPSVRRGTENGLFVVFVFVLVAAVVFVLVLVLAIALLDREELERGKIVCRLIGRVDGAHSRVFVVVFVVFVVVLVVAFVVVDVVVAVVVV